MRRGVWVCGCVGLGIFGVLVPIIYPLFLQNMIAKTEKTSHGQVLKIPWQSSPGSSVVSGSGVGVRGCCCSCCCVNGCFGFPTRCSGGCGGAGASAPMRRSPSMSPSVAGLVLDTGCRTCGGGVSGCWTSVPGSCPTCSGMRQLLALLRSGLLLDAGHCTRQGVSLGPRAR